MIDTVVLKVTGRCNIDCAYCYVYQMGDTGWLRQPKVMSPQTCVAVGRALSELSFDLGYNFAVVLHGGEPLLLGKDGLDSILSTLRRSLPSTHAIGIQTNGTLINSEILDVCATYDASMSVSLDGPRAVHDRHRVGFDALGTFDLVMEGLRLLQSHPAGDRLFTGILAVVDPTSNPTEVYSFFKTLGIPSVDFLYRDGNHSLLPVGKASPSSTEYGEWMTELLDIYVADPDPIRVRILDDLIRLVLGGTGTKDGVGLTSYGVLVVDTDGSLTKNDILKSSFDGADRFDEPWSVHTHQMRDFIGSSVFSESVAQQRPSSPICRACPELEICGGGTVAHRWNYSNGYGNTSIYCADQKLLINRIRSHVQTFLSGVS